MARKTQLSASEEVTTTQQSLSKMQAYVEDLKRRRGVVETEEAAVCRAHEETLEKIRNSKVQIEKNIFSFLNKTVKVA